MTTFAVEWAFFGRLPSILTPSRRQNSKLVRDADAFAREVYDEVLWAHCVRTYYFGLLVAAFDDIKCDRELFYAAAICHDAGANQGAGGPVKACCFAHSGGRLTYNRLCADGHGDGTALRVADAISTHMNLYVPQSAYPAESTLTAVGATCDVIGSYVRRIELSTLAAVVDRWPRTGLLEAFGAFLTSEHLEDSRTDVLGKMRAFEGGGVHPIEAALGSL